MQNEDRMERLSDAVNDEKINTVHTLPQTNHCLNVSNLHYKLMQEYPNMNIGRISIFYIITEELEMWK